MSKTKMGKSWANQSGSRLAVSKPVFSVKIICQMALLVALEIVFNRLLSINTEAIKIGFSFVPIVMCAVLFGPLHAAIVYALADTVGALMFPLGAYMPLITLSCFCMGFVFGLFLNGFIRRDEEISLKSFKSLFYIMCPVLINNLIFGLLLNSLWLSLLYTKGFVYFFSTRLVQNAILIPVQIIVIPLIVTLARRLRKASVA